MDSKQTKNLKRDMHEWVMKASIDYPTERLAVDLETRDDEYLEVMWGMAELLPYRLYKVLVAERTRRRMGVE